jgi:GDP-4-dehydro-6-deoxy-D-mannose reductase
VGAAFITGIAGFAGSHLAERLIARGDRVSGLVRGPGPFVSLAAIEPRTKLYRGDICDLDHLASALEDARPSEIYHLAGRAAPRLSFDDPAGFFRTNALGTATLLEAVRRAGLEGARVLVVSSAEVYGRSGGTVPIPEDAPLRPCSPYGASKAAAEMAAIGAFEAYGLAVVRARAFNHTGARQSPEFAPAAFARQIARAEAGLAPPEVRVGPLDGVRDLSHVKDVVAAYEAIIARGRPGEVYNVGSGRGVRIGDVLSRLLARARVEIRLVADPAIRRPADVPARIADIRRLESEIGFSAKRSLDEALDALLDDWRRREAASPRP